MDVHGDDFTALGTDESLDKDEAALKTSSECKLRGRLGVEAHDDKELGQLKNIIRITDQGLLYEADPRHTELLAKSMNLEQCRHVATPGLKKGFTDDVMDLPIAPTPEVIANVNERMSQVQFTEATPEVKLITPYYQVYGRHPSRLVFHKKGCKKSLD